MSNFKGAEGYRRFYQDISGSRSLTTTTDDTVLVAAKDAYHTIYIQRIVVYVTTDAAQSWVFSDNDGTPKKIAEVTISPGDETRWEFFYGEQGIPLTQAASFIVNVSAIGLAGNITWEGYSKLTGVTAADNL